MKLDLEKVKRISENYTVQELFAALVWSRRFNDFDGQQIMTDLVAHPELWRSFLFSKPIFAPDEHGLSFSGLVEALIALAEANVVTPAPGWRYVPYPADTLFVLTVNQEVTVSQLVDFGRKWQADEVNVLTAPSQALVEGSESSWYERIVLSKLKYYDDDYGAKQPTGAAIVQYWWG